ncbi:hypothetical protein [Burkholderia pyrrocinia]|uniref:hypothetical protein n=1 Tax=Burkholderia pyrrocinia TaxID=60550 RepID=UPI00158911FA|nr:hypothetical protein [Burkholderia pyrrocinia]
MEDFVDIFKQKHPQIKIKENIQTWEFVEDNTEVEEIAYEVSAIPHLGDMKFILETKEEFDTLDSIIQLEPTLFSDLMGGRFGEEVEVVLMKISKGGFLLPGRTIEINLAYRGTEVSVAISNRRHPTNMTFLARKNREERLTGTPYIATISGLGSLEGEAAALASENILRSVLFDFEYTYGLAFEAANFEKLRTLKNKTATVRPRLPSEPIRMMHKEYIPELIEYFHTAEKVDHLPFKYICYFHVLEYFMDKSAYGVVSRKIKQLLLSPDFHIRSAEHISTAINIIKQETEKNATDKIKINRVLSEFTQADAVKQHLSHAGLIDHFNKDHTIQCGKPLKIGSIKFDSETSYVESAAKRIYALRCSIVHSNPDFDESKAIPFIPTPTNIDFLRIEIGLVKEIARTIIANSMKI